MFKSLRTEELVKVSECVAKSTILEIGETFIHLARLESPFEIGCDHCDTILELIGRALVSHFVFVEQHLRISEAKVLAHDQRLTREIASHVQVFNLLGQLEQLSENPRGLSEALVRAALRVVFVRSELGQVHQADSQVVHVCAHLHDRFVRVHFF